MISSTTLILATLVFNAASILGAPIRIPDAAPEVVKRAPAGHAQPTQPIARAVPVVDAQPLHRRSVNGMANRPRLAREPAPSLEARNEFDPDGHFVRDHNPELMAKRDALPTDNVPREPEPAPASNAAPAADPELVRRFPRRVYAEYYAKRQDNGDPEKPVETPTATPTATPTSTSSTSTTTTSSTATDLPASLEKAIADAIVKGSSSPVANTVTAGKKSSYSDTTITIKITHQANSDVTTPEKPSGSTNPPPTGTSVVF
ncbi:hypothetical protein FA13DRAFT_972541 [Coprinellus micaceus]|uniref:Uncharacterized protein n=1 Tax=Coprinellus micaceus TaxID=71717 RepID=A0A4Y7SYW2_COPMI|nr:hypothetical protein FA13DRAFT_972541 [Coprinellus micaceus]